MEANEDTEKQELDPADYLLQTTRYHDRHITVGNPETDQVEIIGVSSPHLVSHSTVFREMLVGSKLADPTGNDTHITDISPEVFKLMLRHIYGGKWPDDISRETASNLALCADKYNIKPLVSRAAAMLVPTTLPQVFLSLSTVVYINAPNLESHVVKIIQDHTKTIIADKEFLLLDPNCLEFITKQDTLSITELELWRALLNWAKHQTSDPAEMRQLLNKALRHVRFLSLTRDEFFEEVVPSTVLSSEESVDLLLALSGKKPLQLKGLCSVKEQRVWKESSANTQAPRTNCRFDSKLDSDGKIQPLACLTELRDYALTSNFTIRTFKNEIELQSFTCKARRFLFANQFLYEFRCDIEVFEIRDGFYTNRILMSPVNGQVLCGEDINLNVSSKKSTSLKLEPSTCYRFILIFSQSHPVFTSHCVKLQDGSRKQIDTTNSEKLYVGQLSVNFNSPFHVQAINFRC